VTALARERALRGEGKYERKQNNYSEILAQAVRSTLSLRAIGRTDSEFKAVRAGSSSRSVSLLFSVATRKACSQVMTAT